MKWGFIPRAQGWFSLCTLIYVIYHINKIKDNNNTISSIDAEKSLGKIQHPFMIKTLNIMGIGGKYLNIIKDI